MDYHYNQETGKWVSGLAIADQLNRKNNGTIENVILNPYLLNIIGPDGKRQIMDITRPEQRIARGYSTIVDNPGEWFFDPTISKWLAIETVLKTVFPPSSAKKLREIFGELIDPSRDPRIHVVNFSTDTAGTNFKPLVAVVRKLFEMIFIQTNNFVTDITHTNVGTETTYKKVRRPKYVQARIQGQRYARWIRSGYEMKNVPVHTRVWKINYNMSNRYIYSEQNRLTQPRAIFVQGNAYLDHGWYRKAINLSPDGLSTNIKYDQFMQKYIKTIKPKKTVARKYGVNPIRVAQVPFRKPIFVSFTNKPLTKLSMKTEASRDNFRLVQIKIKSKVPNDILRKLTEVNQIFQNWILNGLLERRRREERGTFVGLIDVVLGRTVEEPEPDQKMYFLTRA